MDIIGSFFVDIFYNDLYLKARDDVRSGKAQSITDAYRSNIINYMRGIKQSGPYTQVVRALHEYYQRITVFSTITFGEFENKILAQFIPIEYFRDFTEKNKDGHMYSLTKRVVIELGESIIVPETIKRIIDDHMNRNNVLMLQDSALEIMRGVRDEYFIQFARTIGQRPDTVSADIAAKLKSTIVDETKKRVAAERDRDAAMNIVRGLAAQIKKLEAAPAPAPAPIGVDTAEHDRVRGELTSKTRELERARAELTSKLRELEQARAEQERLRAELSQARDVAQKHIDNSVKRDTDSSGEDDDETSSSDEDEVDEISAEEQRQRIAEKIAERRRQDNVEDEDVWM